MQDIRQQRLESDKEMYARRLQLAKAEAQQKAEEANKRCCERAQPSCVRIPLAQASVNKLLAHTVPYLML